MTPDAAAERPTSGLDWLKGLLPRWDPDPTLAEAEERLKRLEAETEQTRREGEGER